MFKKMDWLIRLVLTATMLAAAAALLNACVPAPQAGDPASTETITIKVTEAGDEPPAFIPALQADLAQQLSIDVAQISLKEVSGVMWPDSCLGVPLEGMMCAEVITPGYRIIFTTPQGDYEYHTDKDGSNYRLLSPEEGQSGIKGQVLIGPNCPGPIREGDTNCADKAYQATITVLDSSGQQVTQFQSDSEGNFQVILPPGTYLLKPEMGDPLPRADEQTVEVLEGQFTPVAIHYDTGMR